MSGRDFADFHFSPIFGIYRKLTTTDKINEIFKKLLKINKAVLEKTLSFILSVYPNNNCVKFLDPTNKNYSKNRVDFVKSSQ